MSLMNDEIGECTVKINAVIGRLQDMRDGAILLGLKPLSEKLHYEIEELQTIPTRLNRSVGSAIQNSFRRSKESSKNMLKVALARWIKGS